MLAYLFPGQGAQKKGMGEHLFDQFPKLTQAANDILGYCIKTLCLSDPDNKLIYTNYTQPALYVVNALHFYERMAQAEEVDFVLGHSLGEYNALLAANVFDFETGLRLVQKRSALMANISGGTMAAIIGLTYNRVEAILQEYSLTCISIANYNSYRQFVIAGPKSDIERAKLIFEEIKPAVFIMLNVSGAFHTLDMIPAEKEFADFLGSIKFNRPTLPVIANWNATIYHDAVIAKNLAQHLSHPVQWSKSIENLLQRGVKQFTEIGPGSVLSGLVRRIQNGE